MSRRCDLTGKHLQFGHNVAHSNRKTNRRFLPNIQSVHLQSEALGTRVRLDVSARGLRTVQKKGGLDAFLLKTDDRKLPVEAQRVKRRVQRALSGKARRRAAAAAEG